MLYRMVINPDSGTKKLQQITILSCVAASRNTIKASDSMQFTFTLCLPVPFADNLCEMVKNQIRPGLDNCLTQ